MAFHDVTLPDDFQYGSTAGAGFSTIVQQTASGHEIRVARQSQAVHRMSLRTELQSAGQAKVLKAFALARRGSLHAFKIKDWSDYTSAGDGESAATALDQVIGSGNGTTTTFQLVKRYETTGPNPYIRTITLPISGTVVAAIDGITTTAFTVSGTGQIVFSTAPGNGTVVTAGFQFHVPVRFTLDVDRWTRLQADAFNVWSLPTLDVQEVLNEVEYPERWQHGGSRFWGYLTQSIRLAFNDGGFHIVGNLTATVHKIFLPVPTYAGSGPHMFTIYHSGGSTNLELCDDAGNFVATLAPSVTTRVALSRSGSNVQWHAY
jgi:uncharacterized protein (TIGR02217 family)